MRHGARLIPLCLLIRETIILPGMKNLAVFASGGGSNLQSIINEIESGKLDARVAFVLSNNSGAGALERARKHHIPAIHFSTKTCPDPVEYEKNMAALLREHHAECIILAGYMKMVPHRIVRDFRGRILNIHPSLLPKFGGQGMFGMNVHSAVVAAGEKESGATVFFVTEEYDAGPVLLQDRVALQPGDTPEEVAARVLEIEHRLYPEAIRRLLDGRAVMP